MNDLMGRPPPIPEVWELAACSLPKVGRALASHLAIPLDHSYLLSLLNPSMTRREGSPHINADREEDIST
jgi:hypothetical protein